MMWKKTKNSLNGKETEKVKKKTNRDIWFTGIFFSLLFVAMMGYYAHFVHTQGDEMINSSYNSRQKLLTAKNTRGTIYSADGQILAETVTFESGNEVRNYPYENLFAHVVGFSTKGKTGIEAQANPYLIQSNIALSSKLGLTQLAVGKYAHPNSRG